MKHKHYEAIIQWANGAVVQDYNPSIDMWETVSCPLWLDSVKYRASLAIVEGKPVFEGDVLWNRHGRFTVIKADKDYMYWHECTWNTPKPATITVTIPIPDERYLNQCVYLNYEDKDKAAQAYQAIKDAIK